jgi:hypothetical protein
VALSVGLLAPGLDRTVIRVLGALLRKTLASRSISSRFSDQRTCGPTVRDEALAPSFCGSAFSCDIAYSDIPTARRAPALSTKTVACTIWPSRSL